MTKMRGFSVFVAAVLFSLVAFGRAEASFIYDYNSTCSFGCTLVSLNDGDPVAGTIEFDETNFVANGSITDADIVDFGFTFGSVAITFASAGGFRFIGGLGPDAMTFDTFIFVAAEVISPSLLDGSGDFFEVNHNGGSASQAGRCSDSTCVSASSILAAPMAAAPLSKVTVAVSEPSSSYLIAAGLAILMALGSGLRRHLNAGRRGAVASAA